MRTNLCTHVVRCSRYVDDLAGCHDVTIVAYGETGSGKTHSMERLVENLANRVAARVIDDNCCFAPELAIAAVEVYCNGIYDLLDARRKRDIHPQTRRPMNMKSVSVFKTTEGVTPDESLEAITTNLRHVFATARRARSTAAHAANDASSRSHAFFYVSLTYTRADPRNTIGVSTVTTTLTAVDLAGSESRKVHADVDARLASYQTKQAAKQLGKEQGDINQSLAHLLTMLQDVRKGGPLRTRNHNLTRALEPCVTGGARLVVLCTLGPFPTSAVRSTINMCETVMGLPARALRAVTGVATATGVVESVRQYLQAAQSNSTSGDEAAAGSREALALAEAEASRKRAQILEAQFADQSKKLAALETECAAAQAALSAANASDQRRLDELESLQQRYTWFRCQHRP